MKSISQSSKLLNSVTTRVHVLRHLTDSVSLSYSEELEIDRKDVVPGDLVIFTSALPSLSIMITLIVFQVGMFSQVIVSSFCQSL